MSDPSNNKQYLPNSSWCFVCGEDNHAGLRTRFYVEDGYVKTRLSPREHHCGYPNVVHGGVVAAIIDECMGWAASRVIQRMCVTGELNVRYIKNVPADQGTTVVTEVLKANKRLVYTQGWIVGDDGTEYARGEGKFTPLSPEETVWIDDQLNYSGEEERLFDELRKGLTGE